MSDDLFLPATGSLFAFPARIVCARWGGGAKPGKWHVYPTGGLAGWERVFGVYGMDCVVDDFGNLVKTQ